MKNIFASSLVVFFALTSSAAITVFTDKAAFTAATTEAAEDQFTDVACGDVTPSPLARTAGAYTYQASSPFDFFSLCIAPGISLSANDAYSAVNFDTFTGDVSAVGADFFLTDFDGLAVDGSVVVTVTDSAGDQSQQTVTSPATFMGFTSDQLITSVTVDAVQASPDVISWATINTFITGKSH